MCACRGLQAVLQPVDREAAAITLQQVEVRDLLKKLVQKQYRKNLQKTLTYELKMGGTKPLAGLIRVRAEAASTTDAREAAVRIDYFVTDVRGQRVVDVALEGSSMTKNYYEQFHKMLVRPEQGFAHVVKKIKEKLSAD